MSSSPKPETSSFIETKVQHKRESSYVTYKEQTNEKSSEQEVNDVLSNEGTKSGEKRPSERVKKKTPWYSALYPTYKSRSDDFKRIFKELPPEERLIVDYSCAIQRDILVHGRLYISQNYLCFYANIFRWETQVIVKWRDVTSITKEKTALVIPNAILVSTTGDKHFFTSFATRDKSYLMVFRVWQNALMEQPMSMQELWQWVHTCYGDELGLTSDDDDYVAPPLHSRLSDESKVINKTNGEISSEDCPVINRQPTSSEEMHEKCDKERSPSKHIFTMNGSVESDLEKDEAATCPIAHEGRMIVNDLFPIGVDELFTLLFMQSKFTADIYVSLKYSDVKESAWEVNSTSQQKMRNKSMTVPIAGAVMGSKFVYVTETQVMLSCSKPGEMYVIEIESTNAGVPYAESFYISTHFCLTRGSSNNEACLSVYIQIKYRKSIWGLVKGLIEKNVWSGIEEFYAVLVKGLEAECGQHKATEPGAEVTESKPVRRKKDQTNETANPKPVQTAVTDRIYSVNITPSTVPVNMPHVDIIGRAVLCILLLLLLLNAVLYYKLWSLEEFDRRHRFPSVIDIQLQKHTPRTQDEWVALLHKQERLHSSEIQHWQEILKKVVLILREAEDSLNELQANLRSTVSERVLSALKEIYPESTDTTASSEQEL